MSRRGACLLLLAALAAPPAAAWAGHGHRVVAEVAQARLTPAARAQVATLLADEPEPTLVGVSDWADDLRKAGDPLGRTTERWHFINFPRSRCSYVAARDCPDGNCVVAAIERQRDVLADAARPRAERAQALKFLAHFVADAHQPLHAGFRDDLGGNKVQLRWAGEGTNLHAVWDHLLPRHRGLESRAQAAFLLAQPAPPASASSPASWAEESCALVQAEGFYPRGRQLQAAYLRAQLPVAERRLRQAGERLAALLNRALAPGPKP